jgi:hypothetical protein
MSSEDLERQITWLLAQNKPPSLRTYVSSYHLLDRTSAEKAYMELISSTRIKQSTRQELLTKYQHFQAHYANLF